MIPVGEVLNFVLLVINGNILNNISDYTPRYLKSSSYYYKGDSSPRSVEFDIRFFESVIFPKCCPAQYVYDYSSRSCVESTDISPIYEDLGIKLDVIRSGLTHCQVVADRFVETKNFARKNSNDGEIHLEIDLLTYLYTDFCLDKTLSKNLYAVRICEERSYCVDPKNEDRDWCVNKCCWDGCSYQGRYCKFTSKTGLDENKYAGSYEVEDGYAYLFGLTTCPNQHIHQLKELDFTIRKNGSLLRKDNGKLYNLDEYCMESLHRTDSKDSIEIVVLCEDEKEVSIRLAVILIVVIILCACFATAFMKSVLIYELEGALVKLVACYSLIEFSFWFMTAMRLIAAGCGYFCHVFAYTHVLLSIFRLSWLNVLSYEIWATMGLEWVHSGIATKRRIKYLLYVLYAVTVPAIIMIIFIMSHQKVYPLVNYLLPKINLFGCVAQLDTYGAIHVLIPVCILILVNLIYFGLIIFCCPPRPEYNSRKISYIKVSTYQDITIISNKKMFIIVKLGLVNMITCLYYLGEFLGVFESAVLLENVGNVEPSYTIYG